MAHIFMLLPVLALFLFVFLPWQMALEVVIREVEGLTLHVSPLHETFPENEGDST